MGVQGNIFQLIRGQGLCQSEGVLSKGILQRTPSDWHWDKTQNYQPKF